MAELTVDMTYANALYQAATELDKTEIILDEGFAVLDVLKNEKELYALLVNPTIAAEDKKNVLEAVFGGKIEQELLNLLMILVDRGRFRIYERMMSEYRKRVDHEEGFSYGTIYSAVPLSDVQREQFEQKTAELIRENVKLENEIDTSIIGGVKILIDGKVIDASIKHRLEDLGSSI